MSPCFTTQTQAAWPTMSCPTTRSGQTGYVAASRGMNLLEVLKQFGLVNYDVWIEKK